MNILKLEKYVEPVEESKITPVPGQEVWIGGKTTFYRFTSKNLISYDRTGRPWTPEECMELERKYGYGEPVPDVTAMEIQRLNDINRKDQMEKLANSKKSLIEYEMKSRNDYYGKKISQAYKDALHYGLIQHGELHEVNVRLDFHQYARQDFQMINDMANYKQSLDAQMQAMQLAQISSCWTMTDAQLAQITMPVELS